jgi:hypothetical protein
MSRRDRELDDCTNIMLGPSPYLQEFDVNASSAIEAGGPDEIEDGEFSPSDFEFDLAGTLHSISPTVLRHSYENGRRVRYPALI